MSEWKLIKDAPRDKTQFLARCEDGRVMIWAGTIFWQGQNSRTPDHLSFPAKWFMLLTDLPDPNSPIPPVQPGDGELVRRLRICTKDAQAWNDALPNFDIRAGALSSFIREMTEATSALEAKDTQIAELVGALRSAVKVADEARDEWDYAPSEMRAGKIIIALSGKCRGYRADTDAIHATLAKHPSKDEP
jgi:hypothetical protein